MVLDASIVGPTISTVGWIEHHSPHMGHKCMKVFRSISFNFFPLIFHTSEREGERDGSSCCECCCLCLPISDKKKKKKRRRETRFSWVSESLQTRFFFFSSISISLCICCNSMHYFSTQCCRCMPPIFSKEQLSSLHQALCQRSDSFLFLCNLPLFLSV